MKLEYESEHCTFIALNPKTYFCQDYSNPENSKMGSKGVQKTSNLKIEDYEKVLLSSEKKIVTVNSLTTFKNEIFSTSKIKTGLTNLFLKGYVEEDDITIRPFKKHICKE